MLPLKYRINRFLSYYFLDFSLLERIGLWKRLLLNEWIRAPNEKKVKSLYYNVRGIYVISLPYRLDRRNHIQGQFHAHHIPFKFFNAVSPNRIVKYYKYFSIKSFKNLTLGSKACASSHISLWESIYKEKDKNGTDLYVIFEDDVVLKENFNTFYIKQKLPANFDILFLGGWNTRERDINYFVSKNVFSCYNPRKGLYAYVITVRGAKRLLENSIPLDIIYGGIDTKIGKLVRQRKLIAYHIYPNMVDVNLNLPSDIYNPSQQDKIMYKQS